MQGQSKRFVVHQERPPANKPSGWRGLYQVWDQSLRTIKESFWSWGAADKYARCLNGELSPFLCRDAAPQQSHAERWALAA